MAKKKRKAKKKQSQKPTISESFFWKVFIIFLISCASLIGYFKKDQIIFYYANYFKESKKHHTLTNYRSLYWKNIWFRYFSLSKKRRNFLG